MSSTMLAINISGITMTTQKTHATEETNHVCLNTNSMSVQWDLDHVRSIHTQSVNINSRLMIQLLRI